MSGFNAFRRRCTITNQNKAYVLGLITVLCWSTVASAFKLSLRYLDYVQLLLYSSLTSILVLAAILALQGRFRLIFSYSPRQYGHSLLMGLLNPFLYYLILFKSYELLPAQEAQPINYTWAITLALLSIPLLKQPISRRDIIAALISYSGVLIISTHGRPFGFTFSSGLGVALVLASTVIWSLYWILNIRDARDPVAGLLLNFLFSLPFILAVCLCVSTPRIDSLSGLAGAVYVGLFEMGITFVLWLSALRLSENTAKVGNLIFISPFLSLVFIHFLVGEAILPSTFGGLALIVAGLTIQQLKKGRKAARTGGPDDYQ